MFFAGIVFTNEEIERAVADKALVKIPDVSALPDKDGFQVHSFFLYLYHNSVKEFSLLAAGGIDLTIKLVTQDHQLVNASNDPVLFGERG